MTAQEARIFLACFAEELREVQSKIATLLDKVDDENLIQEGGNVEMQIGHGATLLEKIARPNSEEFTLIRQLRDSVAARK